MKKLMMILGKLLIVIGMLISAWYANLCTIVGCLDALFFALLATPVLGVVLCVVSGYRSANYEKIKSVKYKDTVLGIAVKWMKWAILIYAAIFCSMFVIIGLYYTFFSKYAPAICLTLAICGLVLGLLWQSYKYFKNYKNN